VSEKSVASTKSKYVADTDQSIVAHLPASLSVEFHRKAEQLQIPAED
jgi:hypothetical protein